MVLRKCCVCCSGVERAILVKLLEQARWQVLRIKQSDVLAHVTPQGHECPCRVLGTGIAGTHMATP